PHQFKMLVWNIQKGQDKDRWARDFAVVSAQKDLILIQEGMRDSFVPVVLKKKTGFGWWLAKSFYQDDGKESTGVITGSKVQPVAQQFRRSPGREPITATPKMTLINYYTLPQGTPLMVVNTHGINFVSTGTFQDQMEDVGQLIRSFKGKVIWAGDFNTWNKSRTDILERVILIAGLKQVPLLDDDRSLVLDHIFMRGCVPVGAKLEKSIKTSDHYPLTTGVICPENGA
ncbi:MAG: endonuclease/exonuclease/phosphatase family protein, partial [Pseudobdellovibrionaceae bacterium]